MQRFLNSRENHTRYGIEVCRLLHILNHFLKQVLGVEPVSKEASVDLIQPALAFSVSDGRQYSKESIYPTALRERRRQGLVIMDEYITEEQRAKQRRER